MEAVTLLLLLSLLPPDTQAAGQAGTASGTVVLNGRTAMLTHAYASASPGMFDKTKEDIRVLLSDVPLLDAARADVFALMALARSGRATIVEVLIDDSGAVISGDFFAKEFNGMVSATGMHTFTRSELTRTRIAGRLSTREGNHTFMGVTYAYDAGFAAPIPRTPTSAEREASLATAPARAAAACIAALVAGDFPAFLETMTPTAAARYRTADGPVAFARLRAEFPVDGRVIELIPQIDGTVLVKVEGRQGAVAIGYSLRMSPDAGSWKVAAGP